MAMSRPRLRPAHAWSALLLGLLLAAPGAGAHEARPADDAATVAEITAMLDDFLENVDQAAAHERFWAADVVYTNSSGVVTGHPTRARAATTTAGPQTAPSDTTAENPDRPAPPRTTYSAEDVLVRPYGDTAALTFRLVANAADGGRTYYRNSGMFVRRDGQWQVVTWQATPVAAK